jgi:SAM-dependent methyltransferase
VNNRSLDHTIKRFGETPTAREAYDRLAPRFDALLNENAVLAHAARVSLGLVTRAMADSEFILDIGCGTGREALAFARGGKRVVACDPSEESLKLLRAKAAQHGLSGSIMTFPYAASAIGSLISEFGPHSFDGAYSSFALSYEPSLDSIPAKVRTLLKPGAPFLCSIYNRLCLSEILLLAPFLVPRRAFRRLEGQTRLPVDQFEVVIRSYTAAEVLSLFEPSFEFVRAWGIPCIVPPNYLSVILQNAGPFRSPWEEWDLRLNGRWPFRYLGSHTAYLFRAGP